MCLPLWSLSLGAPKFYVAWRRAMIDCSRLVRRSNVSSPPTLRPHGLFVLFFSQGYSVLLLLLLLWPLDDVKFYHRALCRVVLQVAWALKRAGSVVLRLGVEAFLPTRHRSTISTWIVLQNCPTPFQEDKSTGHAMLELRFDICREA